MSDMSLNPRPMAVGALGFESCRAHQVIAQTIIYQKVIDDDWSRISDWYRVSPESVKPGEPLDLYEEYVLRVLWPQRDRL